jgi:hypothetical protein
VVPFLIIQLQSTNGDFKAVVVEALGRFGHESAQAVPALLEIVYQPGVTESQAWHFTNIVNQALQNIDPAVAEKARREWGPIPLDPGMVFRPKPTPEQWLGLGASVGKTPQDCPLADWLKLAKGAEPRYRNRSLTQWLSAAAPPITSPAQDTTILDAAWNDSHAAVTAIGTNAIPWLLDAIETAPSERARLGVRGFTLLGKEAQPSFWALIELIQASDEATRQSAYGCLARLKLPWATIWPALGQVLHSSVAEVRQDAACFLWDEYHQEATEAGLKAFIPPFGVVPQSEP